MTSDDPTLAVLAVIERRIRERAGLCPPRWMLLGRVRERAATLGLPLPAYLRDHAPGPDLDPLIHALRIGETRFYRHPDQMAWLRDRLPALLRRAAAEDRPLRAWSAGCATGEEAWTLAMLLCEARKEDRTGATATILATDLSAAALRVAEAGAYPAAAAAALPADLAARYLVSAPGETDQVAVAAGLRAEVPVRFRHHNLLQPGDPGPFDLILCRNVLIYFDPQARGEALRRLRDALVPGGVLLLGPSEAEGDPGPGPLSIPRAARQTPLLRLRGAYGGGERLKEELRPLLAQGRDEDGEGVEVDLDGADYLDDDDARILRRAAEVAPLRLRCTSPRVRRWLDRQQLPARKEDPR